MLRLSSLSFCYKDGSLEIERAQKQLGSYQLKYKIEDLPSIIEVFSYTCTICGSMAGPFIEFKEYNDFMYLRGNY
jgi:hypothetical protein